ncbi:MAG: hypothetical protein JWO57_929 [Pseudonocardiales bacterium]|nr:hypothetical protein [Pseudonocardiales bacterium]
MALAVVVAAVIAASLVLAVVHNSGSQGLAAFAENSLGVIDPGTGRLVGQVGIGVGPTAVAAGFGSIWTTNIDANSVSRVDASTLHVIDTIDPTTDALSARVHNFKRSPTVGVVLDQMWVR